MRIEKDKFTVMGNLYRKLNVEAQKVLLADRSVSDITTDIVEVLELLDRLGTILTLKEYISKIKEVAPKDSNEYRSVGRYYEVELTMGLMVVVFELEEDVKEKADFKDVHEQNRIWDSLSKLYIGMKIDKEDDEQLRRWLYRVFINSNYITEDGGYLADRLYLIGKETVNKMLDSLGGTKSWK